MTEVELLNSAGAQCFLAGNLSSAEDFFHQALDIDETHVGAWGNLGLVYQHAGLPDAALRHYETALRLDPNSPSVLTCYGFLLGELGHRDNARRAFERAVEIKPGFPDAQSNLANMAFEEHDFERAWALWEARYDTLPQRVKPRYQDIPLWDGAPTKRLALWPEQGVGDMILFTTLLPDLIGRGQDFVCEVDERLLPAYRRSFPTSKFCLRSESETAFTACTAQSSLEGLGKFLRPTVRSFYAQPHRLLVPPEYEPWKPDGRKHIAISWRSFMNTLGKHVERRKSGPLAMFGPLAAREDIQLVDVQYGETGPEIVSAGLPIQRFEIDLRNNLDQVLAVIDRCYAVVTTCNVTAHMAGALGKLTYVMRLSGYQPLWTWCPDDDGRSLWYPSIQIIVRDTWAECIDAVSDIL